MVTDQTLRTKGLGNLREADLRFLAMSSAVSAALRRLKLGSVSSRLAVHASGSDSSFTPWAFAVGAWMFSRSVSMRVSRSSISTSWGSSSLSMSFSIMNDASDAARSPKDRCR
jgi:hypothetical protein